MFWIDFMIIDDDDDDDSTDYTLWMLVLHDSQLHDAASNVGLRLPRHNSAVPRRKLPYKGLLKTWYGDSGDSKMQKQQKNYAKSQ